MGKGKILIADDEAVLRDLLQDILEKEKYDVVTAEDGEDALNLFFQTDDIDLVILDVLMPKVDGWKVLTEIREYSNVPIIMLTALCDNKDEVEGLTIGADDYIAKPFSYEVLVARVNTQFRRNNLEQTETLTIGEIQIDQLRHKVFINNQSIKLNNKEYHLLLYLVKNKGIVLNRYQIVTTVWGYDYEGSDRTVDTHIKMLRAKLGMHGNHIKTMRGQGYCFEID